MNFEKEFDECWNSFLKNKNTNDLFNLVELIIKNYNEYLEIEPFNLLDLFLSQKNIPNKYKPTFDCPDQFFYFLNEELANLNRALFKYESILNRSPDARLDSNPEEINTLNNETFVKIVNFTKACFILSKSIKCLDLIINTSLVNQFLSSSSLILKTFKTNDSIYSYYKFLCLLLIRVHDPYFDWFKKFLNTKIEYETNYQRQFTFKFDQTFFFFFYDSFNLFDNLFNESNIKPDYNINALGLHVYSCILNESISSNSVTTLTNSSTTGVLINLNQNDNLIRAITPRIIDFLFDFLFNNPINDENQKEDDSRKIYDKQLIVSKCLPLIINVLHLSLPDKRMVDLNHVLDKSIISLERVKRADIKLELMKSYLTMLNDCSDRAALKIVIATRKFFICLLEQFRYIVLTNTNIVHEYILVCLDLIRNLLDKSQAVKDIFEESNGYYSLYEILKTSTVLDKDVSIVLNEMITEKNSSNKKLAKKSFDSLVELENCHMAVLLIKLSPFMQKTAQEFSLNNICRLCVLNIRNQLRACKNMLLFYLIDLLNYHEKFEFVLIQKLFSTIEILGRCSINNNEVRMLVELLNPKKQFPFGIQILRCFTTWAKNTTSVGLNLSLLTFQYENSSTNPATTNESSTNNNIITAQNENNLLAPGGNMPDVKLKRSSVISINQATLSNIMKKSGSGALGSNAQQQAKYFFDFQHSNSGIRVPIIKKWPGYAFTFHCWIKLRSDVEVFDKKRRQLYSFYSDNGQGFEAFITSDCSSLVVSVCNKKEFISVQLNELDFDSSPQTKISENIINNENNNTTSTCDYWHSITIVHVPSKSSIINPFLSSSQICIYIDGILKKETDLKMPNFYDSLTHIRVGAACSRPNTATNNSNLGKSLAAPLSNFKNVFGGLGYKSGATEKSLNVTTIPAGSQDTVWDVSTCLMGQMSSCFCLHDTITDVQVRLLYELGPNQYYLNWLDIIELSDLKQKFLFHYDAKCCKDLTCFDLSSNKLAGKFSGSCLSCDNFKESLNSIGSIQLFYPLFHYLSSNSEYYDLVVNEWMTNAQKQVDPMLQPDSIKNKTVKRSYFDDSEIEQNVISLILNLIRYLFHNSDIMQDRIQRNNGIPLLSFLLQRLPKKFIDIHLLRICQEYISEANTLPDKSLLNSIYENLIFDFRIWNKADYEIRIGHIQYVSTIIKDDKKYFRKKYGVQFLLDVIKTFFGRYNSLSESNSHQHNQNNNLLKTSINNNHLSVINQFNLNETNLHNQTGVNLMSEDDLRNLRNSFFGLIKYYAQKEIKINELNSILSFLATTRNVSFQNDVLDMLINLLEAPNTNDQLFLLLFEANMADGLYALLVQPHVNEQIQRKLLRIIKILLKTKKVYDKSKSRLRLDECGTYAGLISKLNSELSSRYHYSSNNMNTYRLSEYIVIDLLENLFVDETNITNHDNIWHIISLLTNIAYSDVKNIIKMRLKVCEMISSFLSTNQTALRSLVKSPAWQDQICQLLCIEKREKESNNDLPPIVVLSTSQQTPPTQTTSKKNTIISPIDQNNDEITKNQEFENDPNNLILLKNKHISNLKKTDSQEQEKSLLTSTPSPNKAIKLKKKLNNIDSCEEAENQIFFNDILENKSSREGVTNITSTVMKKDNVSKSLYKDMPLIKTNLKYECDSIIDENINNNNNNSDENNKLLKMVDQSFSSSPDITNNNDNCSIVMGAEFGKGIGGRDNLDTDTGQIVLNRKESNELLNRQIDYMNINEANELCECVIGLIFKLMSDGITGSNEEAWKERCQIFSSMNRLSKEYILLKPIESIELQILEMCLQKINYDSKKISNSKDQALFNENSRELIKIIDYFISKNNKITEKLASLTISLLDQMRTFDKFHYHQSNSNSAYIKKDVQSLSIGNDAPSGNNAISRKTSVSSTGSTSSSQSMINSYGIIHDEWSETSYLGMNILLSFVNSLEIEICAQASAKINTILHNRPIQNYEEACYLIASVEKVMFQRLQEDNEQFYAFLIPIMKCLIEKCYNLLQMNVQVPNIPFSNISPTFFDDFKDYCKTDEWQIFIQKQVAPFREQYLAMTVNPCQMNMKIWWNTCYETLMISIHKRNRILGESKIKFEDSIFNNWKERERQENARYQNYLLQIKRNDLAMRKQLHSTLKFFTSERGSWNEGKKDVYWMLSNHENRMRMRCKLIENLQFDSHFEASRLRDYSAYNSSYLNSNDQSSETNAVIQQHTKEGEASSNLESNNLAKNLQQNKEAINIEINEDFVEGEEDQLLNQQPSNNQQENNDARVPVSKTLSVSSNSSTVSSQTRNQQQQQQQQQPQLQQPLQEHYDLFSQLMDEKEKVIVKSECELITVTRVIKGRFELTNKYIYFFDTFSTFYSEQFINQSNDSTENNNNINNNPQLIINQTSSFTCNNNNVNSYVGFSCHDFDILNDFKLSLTQLKEVQLRRYNLRRSALEFFLINESNFFINFSKNDIRNKIYRKITSMKLPNLISNPTVRTQAELLKASDYTQKWCNHEISNFEYLMKLNTIAGRSYNDLSQYPVFPWILKDYTSESLDLNNPEVYRDLSKPVGVLNKKYEDYVRQKYELFEDPTGTIKPFHYGTHYSNSANVMHYLIRLEPFTTLHIQLQSDRFDLADRQFHSIASTWKILYENPTDVKELIPEFFYLAEFLENMNNFDFGELQISKNKVNNVTLPPWAKSPEHFIQIHRKALESDYVSEHLHEWIDLIFGYKQQGKEAEKALNVFMYCSYEGAIDLDAITDPVARRATEGMISNFGQTPTQLLKEPHVKRKTREQSIRDKILQGLPIILWHQINKLKAYYIELCDSKKDYECLDPVIYISIPRNHVKSFMQQGLVDPLISVNLSGVIGVNGWQAYEKSLTNLFSFEKDPSLLNEKTKKSIAGPFDPNYEVDSKLFVLTHDSKLLISGGHWDNSLRVFSLSKYRNIAQIYQHSNIVTCLAIDFTGTLLVSGSMDCTCMVWQIQQEFGLSVNIDPVPMHILYGHNAPITSVDISNELDIIVSGSLDGTVNIYTILKGYYVRTLSFRNESISRFTSINVKLSNQRQILVYVSGVAHEFVNDLIPNKKNIYEIYLYSINGKLISKEQLSYPVQDMLIKDDYCILGLLIVNNSKQTPNASLNMSPGEKMPNDGTPSTVKYLNSKIVFKEIFDLKTVHVMRLKAPITCMFLTREDSHLLIGLKDGKLIVITGDRQLK